LVQFIEIPETVFWINSEFLISASVIKYLLACFRSSYIGLLSAIQTAFLNSSQISFSEIPDERLIWQLGWPIIKVSFTNLFSGRVIAKQKAVFELAFVTYRHLWPCCCANLAELLLPGTALHAQNFVDLDLTRSIWLHLFTVVVVRRCSSWGLIMN